MSNKIKIKENKLFSKYPYIVAWGQKLGSFRYYVDIQCNKANQDNAPEDAIYYSDTDKRWHRKSECREELQKELDEYVTGKRGGVLA
jgi:hypothetical protein